MRFGSWCGSQNFRFGHFRYPKISTTNRVKAKTFPESLMTLWSLYTLILTPARPPPKYYSPEQKDDTSKSFAAALDPALLMQASGRTPDPWQRKLLRSRSSRQLLLCARQTGKSTATAVIALHRAIYRPRSLVLLLSPGLRQSQELFRKTMELFDAISKKPAVVKRSAVELELVNGSRVVSLPCSEGTIRGYSGAALLVIDEASRVPDELFAAVRPMIATSSGAIICLSTPFGKRGFFYEAYVNGGPRWERFKVTAEECPRISRQFLEEERRTTQRQFICARILMRIYQHVVTSVRSRSNYGHVR